LIQSALKQQNHHLDNVIITAYLFRTFLNNKMKSKISEHSQTETGAEVIRDEIAEKKK